MAALAEAYTVLSPQVSINAERCAGCGKCLKECPRGSLALDHNLWEAVTVASDKVTCVGCRQCQRTCPYQCITIEGPFLGLDRRTPEHGLPLADRLSSFTEVRAGFTQGEAVSEARRCLNCPRPRCRDAGCPAKTDIPAMLAFIRERDFLGALRVLTRTSNLHAICSRVCDQASLCEGACVYHREGGQAVAIGQLERFVGDWAREKGYVRVDAGVSPTGYRVAVVGSGPAGLSAAEDLIRRGHAVTVYDSLPVAGGVMSWAIPDFVLPSELVAHKVDELRRLGVQFRLGLSVSRDHPIERLFQEGANAVFLATGAEKEETLDLPGHNLAGITTAASFLRSGKLAPTFPADFSPPSVGENVLVIGANNAGLHAARTARRLGAGQVSVVGPVLPEFRTAMPPGELEAAVVEGVSLRFEVAATALLGRVRVEAAELVQTVSRRDLWGKAHIRTLRNSKFTLPVDTVIIAAGRRVGKEIPALAGTSGIDTSDYGTLVVKDANGQTSREKVWAAGDIVTGPKTVVEAMVAGKEAAQHIDQTLRCRHLFAHERSSPPSPIRSPRGGRKLPVGSIPGRL